MERVSLLGGTYQTRSLIAAAQRCVNLYPERNAQPDQGDPAPFTHYPRPGLKRLVIPLSPGVGRVLYTATNGALYSVCAQTAYFIDANFNQTALGSLSDPRNTPVGIIDNSNVVVLVDGSDQGYAIDLATNRFGQIIDPSFLGGDNVDYVDTYLVLNQPGTKYWYCSNSNVTFDMLCVNPGRPMDGIVATGGSGGTDGTYASAALTGGTGTGATADITVSGGAVTDVTLLDTGIGYTPGDTLSTSDVPGLSNFTYALNDVFPAAFDPTNVAQKTGFPDIINWILCVHREVWLIGAFKTAEVWYDSGGALFPFAIIPGVFIEHGTVAKYSVAKYDLEVYWLGLDAAGRGTVFMGRGYQAVPISTKAIAAEFTKYPTLSDAIGMVYKIGDHVFYVLQFPSANKTWVFDRSEGFWHEETWTDPADGSENRHRMNCYAFAYNKCLCADWENGNIYEMSFDYVDDFGGPIVYRRALPHLMANGARFIVNNFLADMECGNGIPSAPTANPQLSLRVSRTRGKTWQELPNQPLGAQGEFSTFPQWQKAYGIARDVVFELYWSDPTVTALNGAFIDIEVSGQIQMAPRTT